MARDQCDPPSPHPIYNSGVIVFRQNLPLIKEWADWCVEQNRSFRGDQEVFSHLIGEKKIVISEYPPLSIGAVAWKIASDAIIRHWHGAYGKWVIRNQTSDNAVLATRRPSRIPSS